MAAKKNGVDLRLDEIARVRSRFLTLDREVDEAQRAPLPRDECEARIDAVVEALAAQAAPETLGQLLVAPSRKGSVALPGAIITMLGQGADHGRMMPAGALLAALMPDAMRELLLSVAATAAADQQPPLSATDRAERLKLLEDERLDLERDEASACWAIEDLGQLAPWRSDMDAALVLGLAP